MQIRALKLQTLRQRLFAIVAASFVARVIGFFLLQNQSALALAPDEGGYAEIAKLVANGQSVDSYGGLYIISRPLILPAALLNKLGLDPLSSVRITASIYGLLALILLAKIILKTVDKNNVIVKIGSGKTTVIVALFGVFAFLPSHLLWSMLGLRESPMEFWVLCALATIYWVFYLQQRFSLPVAVSLIVSIVLTFNTRPQVGWVLGVTILIYLVIRIRNRIAIALIPITLLSIGLGYASITAIAVQTRDVFVLIAAEGEVAKGEVAKGEVAAISLCEKDGQTVNFQEVNYFCKKTGEKKVIDGVQNPGRLLVEQTEAIPLRHYVNRENAASAIQTLSCPNAGETTFDKYFCMAWRAPYMSATFLFRPLIGLDVTSTSSLFAAFENIAWLGAFIFIIIMLIKKRRLAFFGPLAPSLIFFTLYCVGAGSYEGNMGTAFRHKSLILWVVLLLVASVIAAEKQPNSGNELAKKRV